MEPLVSVLMTAFNREKYIAEAIKSVMDSTYQNWELIVVDDGSKDRSVEIAKKYEARDSRIKVYVNEKNLGDYPNRNKAASYAKGKYLKYLDSDDIIYPLGLKVMVDAMEKFPQAAFAIPGKPNETKPFPFILNGKEGIIRHFLEEPLFIYGPSAIIFRSSNFFEINGFGSDTYVGSDMDIQLKLAAKNDFLKINPALIWWRVHEEQEIVKGTMNYDYFYNYFRKMYLFITNHKDLFSKVEHYVALKKLRNLYIGKIVKLLFKLKIKPIVKFFHINPQFYKLLYKLK